MVRHQRRVGLLLRRGWKRDALKEGDEGTVKAIDIDPNERKVSLSMKAAAREGDGGHAGDTPP